MIPRIGRLPAVAAFAAWAFLATIAEAQYFIPRMVPNWGVQPGSRVYHGSRSRNRQAVPQQKQPAKKPPAERTTSTTRRKPAPSSSSRTRPPRMAAVEGEVAETASDFGMPDELFGPTPLGNDEAVTPQAVIAERKTAWGRWIAESDEEMQHLEISPSQLTVVTASGGRQVHPYQGKSYLVDGKQVIVAGVPFDVKDPRSGIRFYQFEAEPSEEGVLDLKVWLEVNGQMPFPPQCYELHAMDGGAGVPDHF